MARPRPRATARPFRRRRRPPGPRAAGRGCGPRARGRSRGARGLLARGSGTGGTPGAGYDGLRRRTAARRSESAPAAAVQQVPSEPLQRCIRTTVRPGGRRPGGPPLPGCHPPPVGGGRPPAVRVRDPALTGPPGAGIVVSRAQGALGQLPFAVRLGDEFGRLDRPPALGRKVAAPSREGLPSSVRRGPAPDRATRPTAGAGQWLVAGIGRASAGRPGTRARSASTTPRARPQRR